MAIPAPSMMVGEMNEMWIRQDWLDNLGLEVPRTWDEMAAVAEAFVTQDPDGNGEADTIGILGPSNSDHMNAIGANQFGLDPLFSSFQSYPQYWLQDEDGTVEYGSIQPETREALEKISKLYTNKLIDPEMLVRSDSKEPLLSGKVVSSLDHGGLVIRCQILHLQAKRIGEHILHHCLRTGITTLICQILQVNM